MMEERVLPRSIRAALLGSSVLLTQAWAQLAPADADKASRPDSDKGNAAQVVVTGSRFGSRIVTESSTPIDVVPASEIARSGQLQLQQALRTLVPSFNVSAPATTGALDFTSSPALRGLGPGELLLLVNGKRRHSTGMLNISNVYGRGDVAYDFSAIPTAALGRVEVLRDGASAQYGADAIAGVINLVLDRSAGASASAVTGLNTAGDGGMGEFNGSVGVPLGEDGVVRTSIRLQQRHASNRALPDTRQQYFGSGGTRAISGNYGSGTGLTPSNGTLDPREATIDRKLFRLGEAAMKSYAVFVNAEKPLHSGAQVYAFGGVSRVDGDTPGFYRRSGQDEVVRALYPDGYRPVFASRLDNGSLAVGVKGDGLAGFAWDLSTEYGISKVDVIEANSNNVSYGANSPTSAYTGGTRFAQWTNNLDLTREFAMSQGAPLKLAFGLEWRKEYFKRTAGEAVSYLSGGVPILDGPNAGRPAIPGFQPTAGTTPQDATNQQRHSGAAYAELQREMTRQWLLSGTGRYERFSDFGSSRTFKLASRYELTDAWSVRGSYSSGFRAPNLAQTFSSTTNTTFTLGNPVTTRLLPVGSPIAQLLGATALRPERSHDVSLGTVYHQDAFTMAVDAYRIRIKDRIALSSSFQDSRITQLLAANGYPAIGAVSYMTNAIDTTTSGIDVTSSYRLNLHAAGSLTLSASANHNKTDVDRVAPTPAPLAKLGIATPLYDLTQQVRLTDASPRDKFLLGANWKRGAWTVVFNNTRYGEVAVLQFANATPAQVAALTPGYRVALRPTDPPSANSQVIQYFRAKVISDLNVSYEMGKAILTVGANNLFDVYPDRNIASTVASVAAGTNGADNAGTIPYPLISPFGYTGRSMYARLNYKF
jgi:iron complex outermembrane receptor protein